MLGHVLFKLPHVLINLIGTAAEPFQKARVASRIAAQSRGGDTLAATVFLDSGDKRVKCLHVLDNANWQVAGQHAIARFFCQKALFVLRRANWHV
jgi:hypothetical protein